MLKNNIVHIVVVGYRLPKIERRCLHSIVTHTIHPYVLTFFDNYNSGKSLTETWNDLLTRGEEDYICLLNSDTAVTYQWLSKMMGVMELYPNCGFVGPSTNNCHSPQKTISTEEEAKKYSGKSVRMKDPISGFCLLFRKKIWFELSGFDERYKLYGQESDFLDRAHKLGYTYYWCQDAFVWHEGEASVKAHGYDAKREREIAKKLYWKEREK